MALKDPNFVGIAEPIVRAFREFRTIVEAKFNPTPGHKHTGVAGEGPKITTSSIQFRGALVKRSTNQSLPATTIATLSWESAVYDTDGFWSSANATRLTVPSGITRVRLAANLEFTTSFTESCVLYVYKNGASFNGSPLMRGTGNAGGGFNIISAVVSVVAGDYFELRVYNGNASTQYAKAGATLWFAIEAIE